MADSTSPEVDKRPDFLVVLGLMPPVTEEDVKQAYLEKSKTAHPDRGGSSEQFVALHAAFEQATEFARFKASRMKWLSQWVEQYAEQQELIEEIRGLGGSVEVEASKGMVTTIGNDFATVLERLLGVTLSGPKIDDAAMVHLATRRRSLAGLQRFSLIDTKVTSVGLCQLQYFSNLVYLDLTGTPVSRRALEAIVEELDRLETIVLRRTGIGWAARAHLRFKRRGLTVKT